MQLRTFRSFGCQGKYYLKLHPWQAKNLCVIAYILFGRLKNAFNRSIF